MSVAEAVSALVHQHIVGQERLTCQSNSENTVSARSCFGGLFANILRPGDPKSMSGEASRDSLMFSLLRLVNVLIKIKLPTAQDRNRSDPPAPSSTSSNISSDAITLDSPITDSSKLSVANLRPYTVFTQPKSDEEKGSETDEQKTETAANGRTPTNKYTPVSCSHFKDVKHPDEKVATLVDMVLAHPHIISHLLHSLATCNSNSMALMMGSGGLHSNLRENFCSIDPVSVGDGVFKILSTLNSKATDLKLILTPILHYLKGSHTTGNMISFLSEPLLWFILKVLDCEQALRIFLSMGK